MDENLGWKIVYAACIFSFLILGIAYYFISPRESTFFNEEQIEKLAEFKNTRISGRKEGQKVWEFFAKEGWTDRNREINHLYGVKEGKIYLDGSLVVSQLSSPRLKAFRRTEVVEAFGSLENEKPGNKSLLSAYLNLKRLSRSQENDQKEWTRMKANYLKYIPNQKQSIIEGHVELHKKDSSIYAKKIIIDHDKNIADISEDISLKRKDAILKTSRLKYFSNDEKLFANENFKLNITEGPVQTKVTAKQATFFTEITKDVTIDNNLEVVQGKKLAVAQKGIYSQTNKQLRLNGNVSAVFEKAQDLLKEETARKLKTQESQKILKEKTVLNSDTLVLSTITGDAQASGSVFVSQKGREAKADSAVYDDKQEIITLKGNVSMKKDDEWVNAKEVVVSVKDEVFEAVGEVEAEFIL